MFLSILIQNHPLKKSYLHWMTVFSQHTKTLNFLERSFHTFSILSTLILSPIGPPQTAVRENYLALLRLGLPLLCLALPEVFSRGILHEEFPTGTLSSSCPFQLCAAIAACPSCPTFKPLSLRDSIAWVFGWQGRYWLAKMGKPPQVSTGLFP